MRDLPHFHLALGIGGHHVTIATIDVGVGPVHQVEIHIVESKVLQRLTAGVFHPLWLVEVAPKLFTKKEDTCHSLAKWSDSLLLTLVVMKMSFR